MRSVSDKKYFKELLVESSNPFPIDMLRYDSCFPKTAEDATMIRRTFDREDMMFRIYLIRVAYKLDRCAEARWNSFGWKVLLYDGKPPER